MIGYLSGKVLDHSNGRLLVGVGNSASEGVVGYSVLVPEAEGVVGYLPGNRVELFIHTHVREDALDLYGFTTPAQKDLFLTLQEVNGIGPKLALTILSSVEPGLLIQAILHEDKVALGRISGIGKKTAERLVLELADKIQKKVDAGIYPRTVSAPTPSGAAAVRETVRSVSTSSPLVRDAASALVGLGYREGDAVALLEKIVSEASPAPQNVEGLVRTALRHFL
jgi:Holliday junction DNA helicase RuvA